MRSDLIMKQLLQIEEFGMFVLGLAGFIYWGGSWWLVLLLFLSPDLGMVGYVINARWGAFTYNLTHHKLVAVALVLIGIITHTEWLLLASTIIFAHSSLDRVLGYGLKYPDHFGHTHLGWIGPKRRSSK